VPRFAQLYLALKRPLRKIIEIKSWALPADRSGLPECCLALCRFPTRDPTAPPREMENLQQIRQVPRSVLPLVFSAALLSFCAMGPMMLAPPPNAVGPLAADCFTASEIWRLRSQGPLFRMWVDGDRGRSEFPLV